MTRRKVRRRLISKVITLEIMLLLFLIFSFISLFLIKKKEYEGIFYEGTVVNDVDCSKLTIEEAKSAIESKCEEYVLEITFKDNEVERISGLDIEYVVSNLQSELESIKAEQRKSIYLKGKTYNFEDFSYNEEKLRNVLLCKKQLQNEYMKEKTEISYTYNQRSKLFEAEGKNIYYLDFDEIFEIISNAIKSKQKQISVEDLYWMPDKNEILNEMNSLIGTKITYQLPNGEEYVLDADILYTWLVQNEDGRYVKDEKVWNQNIEEFIEKLSLEVNTTKKMRNFNPTGKSEVVYVESGNYGYLLDKNAEIQMLKEELNQQEIITREPCYKKREVSTENNGIGTSYVEIDLTRQKVWVYVQGNLEIETYCVTGCINQGHETPTGIFTLTYKEKDRILRGPGYASHVDFWMPFNGNIGLHDATWRNSFGGNIYINNGSHGCINLPYEDAKKLYGIIDYEMPIIVYKS